MYITLGGQILEKLEVQILKRIVESASAESARLRLPKARSPSRLGGLGSVVSSPSGVWVGAPKTEANLKILFKNIVHFWILLISYLARGPNYVLGIWNEAPMGLRGKWGSGVDA